jgi:hypothetical protein
LAPPQPGLVSPAPVKPLAPDDGVGLDEADGPQARPRLDARAPRGPRAQATTPVQRGRPLTLRGAWRLQGLGAAGVRLRDLPPSSPALSPLAEGWSKVKTRLRAPAARTLAALEHAIAEALAAVTSQETHGWCAHAGYCIASN